LLASSGVIQACFGFVDDILIASLVSATSDFGELDFCVFRRSPDGSPLLWVFLNVLTGGGKKKPNKINALLGFNFV